MLALKLLRIPPAFTKNASPIIYRSIQMKAARPWSAHKFAQPQLHKLDQKLAEPTPNIKKSSPLTPNINAEAKPAAKPSALQKRIRKMRPRRAAISITPKAVEQLKALSNKPNPQFIRIGVKNRGCSGLTYSLEYVDAPGKFDDEVVQDGVKVLIDSKALFSVIGSTMDWEDTKLASRFIFTNPNSKGSCGCGESFMV